MLTFDLCGATGEDLFMVFFTSASIKIKLTDRSFVSVCKIIAGDGGVGVWTVDVRMEVCPARNISELRAPS